jgi:hypothetical protein
MAEPFNYNVASPMQAFQNSYAFSQAVEQKRLAEQAAIDRKAAIQSIMEDRSPENISKKILLFPELREQIALSESVLNEAEKTSANQLRSEVISLFKAGKPEVARSILQRRADAYANTIGQEKQAAAAQALLKTYDTDPEYLMTTMAVQLAESNKDLYKTLFDTGELTAFQKNQRAAGVDPMSEKGMAQSEQYLQLQIDPIVEMVTPDNVKFVGPRSEYFRRYGEKAVEPKKMVPAEAISMLLTGEGTAAEFDAIFGKGKAAEYLKIRGGQTDKPSGNFQGQ